MIKRTTLVDIGSLTYAARSRDDCVQIRLKEKWDRVSILVLGEKTQFLWCLLFFFWRNSVESLVTLQSVLLEQGHLSAKLWSVGDMRSVDQ